MGLRNLSYANQPAGKIESALDRRVQALELRKSGMPYREIARNLGISLGQAHTDVSRSLKELAKLQSEKAMELRQLTLSRLDAMLFGVWETALTGDPLAVRLVLKIEEQRCQLLGLYSNEQSSDESSSVDAHPVDSNGTRSRVEAMLVEFARAAIVKACTYNLPLPEDLQQIRLAIENAEPKLDSSATAAGP